MTRCEECGRIGVKLYRHYRLPDQSLCKRCIENVTPTDEDETIDVAYDELHSTFRYIISGTCHNV